MTDSRLYNKYGSFVRRGGVDFCVYAPNANYVSVMGDFNAYDKDANPMKRDDEGNWSVTVKNAVEGQTYKYFIVSQDGREFLKADPYARYSEVKPNSASVIFRSRYEFNDKTWLKQRKKGKKENNPISIYEVHLVSWHRDENGGYLNYKEIAKRLCKYVKKMNFTHIELLPITEHPYDIFHKAGIGIILDWVPSHFATDGHGLIAFDGTALYEHPDPKRGYHPQWKSNIFDYGSPYVKSFLISSALWWLREYHIDGIRVDAVASMLYLDYAREEGEWEKNIYGDNLNIEAIALLKELNRHDTLRYFKLDPINRQYHHHELTFMFWYSFEENYILPLSHDEVVHMKGSLINKMSGLYDWKFANLRSMYSFMYAFVGKKLLFMGNEIGQFNEWHYEGELDWSVLDFPAHAGLSNDYQNNAIVFERIYDNERVVVVCNFSGKRLEDYYAPVSAEGKYKLIFNSDAKKFNGEDNSRKRVFKSEKFTISDKEDMIRVDLNPLSVKYFKLDI